MSESKQHQMVRVACAIVDALKEIDQRLLCLEDGDDSWPRKDAVWESIDRAVKTLKDLAEFQMNPNPSCPNCCAGPLEKVPRTDCPRCHGTGKVEIP